MPLLLKGRAVAVQKNSFCALMSMLFTNNCTAFVGQCHSYCTIESACLCYKGIEVVYKKNFDCKIKEHLKVLFYLDK